MSRCALARCSASLHTYRPASSTRAPLTLTSRRPLSLAFISNLRPSIPDSLRPLRNSTTRPSSVNRTQEPFQRPWRSDEHLMMTSFPASTAMLLGRVVSFVDAGRRINNIVIAVATSCNRAIPPVDFIFRCLAAPSAEQTLNVLCQSILPERHMTCK